MRRSVRVEVLLVVVYVAIILSGVILIFVPVVQPTNYVCLGPGLTCAHYVSYSCVWFGIGGYITYSGHYGITRYCPS